MSVGMSSIETAYCGPSVMMSVANVRATPYLTSSQVRSEPSSHFRPSLRVHDQEVAAMLLALHPGVERVDLRIEKPGALGDLIVFANVLTQFATQVAAMFRPDLVGPLQTLLKLLGGAP